ncbi:MAG TPA: single-stranded DNA-binding protein [Chthoniobacterales bacterium]|nr:single-stranded DNA-binding protein [Chthoniobacterales bacterium]
MNFNRVYLAGHLTRDPETRYTPNGTAVAETGLAINQVWTDNDGQKQEETTFVDLTFWGRTAEIAQEYLGKGRPVFIEGRLKLDAWEDKQTGQKRSRLRVTVENLQLLGSKPESAQHPSTGQPPPPPRSVPPPQRPRDPDFDAEPDDIPFASASFH